jgi:molybdopterin molybdotransferase
VAILSTGDELVMPGASPGPDQIFAANAFGLHALLREAGAHPRILPIAPDRPDALAFAFDLALGADLVLTIGGASVGDHDLVAPVARMAGAELAFHKVAMRPGKPLLAGRFDDGRMLLGLPGNPVSAMVCGLIFLVPVIRAMLGLPASPAPCHRVPLAVPLPAGGPREHYLRARFKPDGRVLPFDRQDSSLLAALAEADCLVVQPPHAPALDAGSFVEVVIIGRNDLTQNGNSPRT